MLVRHDGFSQQAHKKTLKQMVNGEGTFNREIDYTKIPLIELQKMMFEMYIATRSYYT